MSNILTKRKISFLYLLHINLLTVVAFNLMTAHIKLLVLEYKLGRFHVRHSHGEKFLADGWCEMRKRKEFSFDLIFSHKFFYPHSIDKQRISDTTAGTVTVSHPPLVNNSVRDAIGAMTKAKITDTYQGNEDINRSTDNRHTKAVIAIPTLPSADFVPSIYLP